MEVSLDTSYPLENVFLYNSNNSYIILIISVFLSHFVENNLALGVYRSARLAYT